MQITKPEVDTANIDITPSTTGADGGAAIDKKVVDGLMTRPADTNVEDVSEELKTYTEEYSDIYLKEHEGVTPHKSLEGGKDTKAFGIKYSLGLKRGDYKSDAEFAAAVALKHRDKVIDKFDSETWNSLADSVKYAIVDLRFNNGTIGSTADKTTTEEMLKNTLAYIGMTTKANEKVSLISLAKRRAWNWNETIPDTGFREIKKIKQIPTATGGTKFEYLDKDGKIIHTVSTTRKPVKLNKKGIATTLTTTREIDL
jgi:hypothetical protein